MNTLFPMHDCDNLFLPHFPQDHVLNPTSFQLFPLQRPLNSSHSNTDPSHTYQHRRRRPQAAAAAASLALATFIMPTVGVTPCRSLGILSPQPMPSPSPSPLTPRLNFSLVLRYFLTLSKYRSKRYELSNGPPFASGWNCVLKIGLVLCTSPSLLPSFKLTKYSFHSRPNVFASTAYP